MTTSRKQALITVNLLALKMVIEVELITMLIDVRIKLSAI